MDVSEAIEALADQAQAEIDKLAAIDQTPLSRRLTAKAFEAAAIRLGGRVEGAKKIESVFDQKPYAEVLQFAWRIPCLWDLCHC